WPATTEPSGKVQSIASGEVWLRVIGGTGTTPAVDAGNRRRLFRTFSPSRISLLRTRASRYPPSSRTLTPPERCGVPTGVLSNSNTKDSDGPISGGSGNIHATP